MTPLDDTLRPPATRILAALDRLPAHLAEALVADLAAGDSPTLTAVAAAYVAEGDRVGVLARSLQFQCLIGDIEGVADHLAAGAPWGDIGSALLDAVDIWREVRPNLTTRRDREAPGVE